MVSPQEVAARAVRRLRHPAQLNSLLELEKAIREANASWAGVMNNAYRWGPTENYYEAQQKYWFAHQKLGVQIKRFKKAFHLPENTSMNNLRKYVKQYKPIVAANVISRSIARAVNNPRTKLGQIKVLSSFGTKVSTRHTPKPNVKSQKIMKRPIPKKGPKTLTTQQSNELLRTFAKLSTR